MMRNILLVALCLAHCWLNAQTVDSVALRQVDSLIQVSRTLTGKQEFDKALEVNIAAEKLALEKLGQESAAYGNCCFNRGRVNSIQQNYSESEKWYLKTLAIREKAVGRQHLYYANTLNTLASLYSSMDNLEKAELLYLEVLAIQEKVQGNEHPDCAGSMYALGIIYERLGNLEKAEQLYLESKTIREKTLGKEHQHYAYILHNLARFYGEMGNHEKAESIYLEIIAICEKTLGKEHFNYAVYLDGLAHLYHEMGNYEKVEPLYLEAIAIFEKPQWNDYPGRAISMFNLATYYFNLGNFEKAEPLHLEAKALLEKIVGKENPNYTSALNELATLHFNIGNYEKSEPFYIEENLIQKKVLGAANSEYASSLRNLANLYAAMGNYAKAEPLYTECALTNQSILEKAVRHLSERELGNYLNKFSESQDQTLSFVQLSASKKVTAACFDNALFYKGFLLQTTGQIKRMSLFNPASTEKFNLLKSYERRLAAQYTQPIADRDSITVADLEAKANDLEKELARTVAGFGQALQQVKWQEVQAALKPGEVAIEFVSYRFFRKEPTDSTMYAALILLPLPAGASAEAGRAEMPQFIPLFEEREIAALFKNKGARKSDYVNTLYTNSDQTAGKQKNLYQAIWQPLENALAGAKTVYFSPAGLLHRINFNAIPGQDGKPLADRLNLVQLGSTRQIALPQPLANATLSPEAMLFGGIDYEPDSLNKSPTLIPQDYASTRGGIDFEEMNSTLRGGAWGYLPWTEKEVNSLQAILKQSDLRPILYKGAEGSEEAFKNIGADGASPLVLHLATHGYFFPDPKRLPQQAATNESAFKRAEHPMIRSGLILAGGNYTWKTGKPFRPDREDGVVTAYEISQMNLSNTELVVLSACETGLGDIEGNEGVYGLQRALKIAGAHYIVMSLWQVPDAQTQELMTAFYTNWFSRKMPIPEAFDAAQKAMRDKYEHPFFWAGFILLR